MGFRAPLFYSTAVLVATAVLAACSGEGDASPPLVEPAAPLFQVTSTAFTDGNAIPVQYTCDGEDVAPPLAWSGLPNGTKSLALIMHDPDAPRGTFVHWVLYGLPPDLTELSEESVDLTRQGLNDFGRTGYGGPCPPRGAPHRYFFSLYALDTEPGRANGATWSELQDAMAGHILAEGVLMGTYQRE